jgi:hypothetical protein
MKLLTFAFFLLIGHTTFGQTSSDSVSNKNYYSYFQNIKGHSINWLRSPDAVHIIIDELIRNGILYHTISIGKLLKLNDTTRLVVTVSFKKDDKEYGILYEAEHGIPLNSKDRDYLTSKNKGYYVQAEKDIKSGVHFIRVDPIPENVFVLKQTCYWYQFDNKGTKYLVDKQMSKNILKQDINDYLKKL